jgi:hypothetical protein
MYKTLSKQAKPLSYETTIEATIFYEGKNSRAPERSAAHMTSRY